MTCILFHISFRISSVSFAHLFIIFASSFSLLVILCLGKFSSRFLAFLVSFRAVLYFSVAMNSCHVLVVFRFSSAIYYRFGL